ncbi:MAG TPA: hypothetical protein VKY65_15805 [Alphaproteobacteria bacterium]|nr:hypothetical protein [Alphaproteobacteria bacterium]
MWCRRSRLAAAAAGLLAALGAALAGCDDIQHPFQPETKPLPAVLAPRERAPTVITVAPVAGVSDAFGRELAAAMVAALRKKEVPAMLDAPADDEVAYSIRGELLPHGAGAGGAAIRWEVRDERGQLVGRKLQPVSPGSDPLSPLARARLLAGLETGPAEEMIKGIEGDATLPRETPEAAPSPPAATGPDVVVAKIEGAPIQDGDIVLRQAIEYALTANRIKVATEPHPDSLRLVASVQQSQLQGGLKHVKVTWRVEQPGGKEVGEVSQENNVPAQLLTSAWGEIANAVARNAAEGIAALVQRAAGPQAMN